MSAVKVIPLQCIYGTEVRMTQKECIDMLESYGRLVQEAAAKAIEKTCFYDEYAGLTANDLAESIRDRPLP